MQKLSLNVENLRVESFEVSSDGAWRGTVAAHGNTPNPESVVGSCPPRACEGSNYGCPSAVISGCGSCGKGCDSIGTTTDGTETDTDTTITSAVSAYPHCSV